jgi:hypothetical protein
LIHEDYVTIGSFFPMSLDLTTDRCIVGLLYVDIWNDKFNAGHFYEAVF